MRKPVVNATISLVLAQEKMLDAEYQGNQLVEESHQSLEAETAVMEGAGAAEEVVAVGEVRQMKLKRTWQEKRLQVVEAFVTTTVEFMQQIILLLGKFFGTQMRVGGRGRLQVFI
jgi:hypothetical protein